MVSMSKLSIEDPLNIKKRILNPDFKKDWDKLCKLVTNKNNKLIHLPAINKMIDLFVVKHKCINLKSLFKAQLLSITIIQNENLE